MHFVGPDQLHGFEDRVTTDMYPGDFGWTPTWEEPKKIHWWFHNMLSVTEAGPYDRSLEMEHDDEVAYTSRRWLHEHARGNDERPFMMCVSFMQPHDPYLGPRADWDSYREDEIDMPVVPYIAPAKREAVGRRMYDLYDRDEYRVTERARARRAARLLRHDHLQRPAAGQVLKALRRDRPGRQHDHRRLGRSWRHDGRARPLVQDELLRAFRPRADDHPCAACR